MAEMFNAPEPALTMVKAPPKLLTLRFARSVDLDKDKVIAPPEPVK